MVKPPDKSAFEFLEEGYLRSYCGDKRLIPYGSIVCSALNKRFGRPEIPQYLKTAPDELKRKIEILSELQVKINGSPIHIALDNPLIRNLQKIVTDRKNYLIEYSQTDAIFNSKAVELQFFWDSDRKRIVQRIYTNEVEDLLLYDIGIVLERDIPICQCYCHRYFVASRWNQKYCPEHGKEGANKARYQNRKNNRCKYKYYKIYNRVLASRYLSMEQFQSDYSRLIIMVNNGEIDEPQEYAVLCELDEKYSVRKRKNRSGT